MYGIKFNRIYQVCCEHILFIDAYSDGYLTDVVSPYKAEGRNPVHMLYEARHGLKLVGLGFATVGDNQIKCSMSVVHPDFRNRGIGTELMRLRVREAHLKGLKYQAEALATNTPSMAMCGKVLEPDGEPIKGVQRFRGNDKTIT